MNVELNLVTRKDATPVPRVLRLVTRQGYALKKLVLTPNEEETLQEIFLTISCQEPPLQLVKLLKKQILVLRVSLKSDLSPLAV